VKIFKVALKQNGIKRELLVLIFHHKNHHKQELHLSLRKN